IAIEAFNQFGQRNVAKHESKIPLRHRTADSILKLMGGKMEAVTDSAQHSEAQEAFADEERYMIGGVLTLAERSVASIMTPRSQISWVDIDDTPEQIREQVLSVPHSLFPVCRGSLDKVLSVVRAKELLDVLEDTEQLKALIKRHRPIYIFEKMKVIDAINTLRTSKGSLVLVSDEFGNVQGLISPLDVFEAIAGEFPDADEQLDLVKINDHTWKASGMLDVYQLELELGMMDLVEEEAGYISLAGLILDKTHGKVSLGAQLEYHGIHFEVTELEENRIKSVLITYRER
ncbi:transporter associated domain-containing protein, partial [Acinetobacter sp. UBA5934]